ncbi:hypothetical protein KC19_7G174600 [Ceratodon purpureus]|uniref:Uncharacterized protein n=1 Tax=Ceratodon purpureus TaxID=3225 RepID=A0A8T0H956_CERPU|nr:hypothetical protein KC19_7G174600 [Ceratodon purpureus]
MLWLSRCLSWLRVKVVPVLSRMSQSSCLVSYSLFIEGNSQCQNDHHLHYMFNTVELL